MKTVGIIAEYNPFHNGHKYHIDKVRQMTGADYCIVVMSGDFVQRGAPAIIDKYARARMALENGADLVLELPVCYASGSAEYFASGAVTLLDKLGTVDCLCFGSECGDISLLSSIAEILAEEPPAFKQALQEFLKEGYSYPMARNNALAMHYESINCRIDVLSSPNNILGIEYIKALLRRNSTITPYTNLRVGSDYHDSRLNKLTSSAIAIRQSLERMDNISLIQGQVPENVFDILKREFHKTYPIHRQDTSLLLKYKLLLSEKDGYTPFADVTPFLSDKIRKNLERYTSSREFCELLKSKDMTYTRISRCLIHILLDIQKYKLMEYANDDYIYYARILGFKESSAELLGSIKQQASIPLISKLASSETVLENKPRGLDMLKMDINAAHIYDSIVTNKFHTPLPNEYRRQIVKI